MKRALIRTLALFAIGVVIGQGVLLMVGSPMPAEVYWALCCVLVPVAVAVAFAESRTG